MQPSLNRLLWRRYRSRYWALFTVTVVIGLGIAWLTAAGWANEGDATIFTASIAKWEVYQTVHMSFFSYWLFCIYWLTGILVVWLDRFENFDQFLFASGYRRRAIYWHKLLLTGAGLLLLTVVTVALQYGIYWLNAPRHAVFNFAWPGFIMTWVVSLAIAVGLFAISWFAALIMGQTGSMLITLSGFTISLVGVANAIQDVFGMRRWSTTSMEWLAAGLWLAASLILLVWGAYLFDRVTLEHRGEYLMFPHLRLPVYLVFVGYMTTLFTINASDLQPAIMTFIITVIFGYWWLWRPDLNRRRIRR